MQVRAIERCKCLFSGVMQSKKEGNFGYKWLHVLLSLIVILRQEI